MITYLEWLGLVLITLLAMLVLAVAIYSFYYVITGKGMKNDEKDSRHG